MEPKTLRELYQSPFTDEQSQKLENLLTKVIPLIEAEQLIDADYGELSIYEVQHVLLAMNELIHDQKVRRQKQYSNELNNMSAQHFVQKQD
ncbi:hypothetical protein [Lysinibacillus sp. NPDC047702]|uniref:hypothetical protein n=1 Tax=unclassified Lysinibacillus TaxID=2636778 RepID=UPI003CFF8164